MKIVINIIAFIVFVAQSISFVLNALTLKKPECVKDSLYNYFFVLAFLFSLITIIVFVVLYNFDYQIHKKKVLSCLIITIAILSIYIHIWQILILKDFIITSCVSLFFDYYIISNLILRKH